MAAASLKQIRNPCVSNREDHLLLKVIWKEEPDYARYEGKEQALGQRSLTLRKRPKSSKHNGSLHPGGFVSYETLNET
jgi:hypothetical protein